MQKWQVFIVLFGPAAASGQQTDLDAGKEAGVGQGPDTPVCSRAGSDLREVAIVGGRGRLQG